MDQQLMMQSIAQTIKDLAEELSIPISEVHQTLSTEMHHLEQQARIRQFVPLLAIKRTKELLGTNRRTPSRAA